MFKHILLATDGSANADAGLELLLKVRWQPQTIFDVLAVADNTLGIGQLTASQARSLAEEVGGKLTRALEGVVVDLYTPVGSAAPAIIRAAERALPDLIVFGAHSKKHMVGEEDFGTVVQKLIDNLQTSLMIAKAPSSEEIPSRVVLCVSNEHSAAWLVKMVAGLEWQPDVEFMLLHVLAPPLNEDGSNPKPNTQQALEAEAAAKTTAQAFLQSIVAELSSALPNHVITARLVQNSAAANTITEVSNEWRAHLIVLGPQEHGKLDDFLPGSLSQEVVSQSDCNVLLLRSSQGNSDG